MRKAPLPCPKRSLLRRSSSIMGCLTLAPSPPQHFPTNTSSNSCPLRWTPSPTNEPLALSCTPCWGLTPTSATPSRPSAATPLTLVLTTSVPSSTSSSTFRPPATNSSSLDEASRAAQCCSDTLTRTGLVTLTTTSQRQATCSSWQVPL